MTTKPFLGAQSQPSTAKQTFYITTAIPYVNGKPHIGHALEYFQADTIRNYHQILGQETLLLSGADENALKNVQAAEKEGLPVQEFLDKNSLVFKEAYEKLGVKLDVFERGSDTKSHFPGVQKLWELCAKNGDIYKKSYTGLYCVGCESFKTDKELIDRKCPDHLTIPDKITEENYFFKLSNYQEKLLELLKSNTLQVVPVSKKNEIVSFIKSGLEDFSISRSRDRAKGVGVPVPTDSNQVMYVWFDALAIYITGIGYGTDTSMFEKWWPADVHVIGKDINRFHTVYWPAMLMSAGLHLPKLILVHGFVQSGGQKMSKTLGNVIDPFEISDEYGLEGFRYFMLSQIPTDGDGDFTKERFKEVYNADLANGLGNLTARVSKLCEKINFHNEYAPKTFSQNVQKSLDEYNFNTALSHIWDEIKKSDKLINEEKPWEKEGEKLTSVLSALCITIAQIGFDLQPFLPTTAKKVLSQFNQGIVRSGQPLFPRLP